MTMKKVICLVLALVMALGCTAAMAEEELQAQLDAANAKIEELQALVDAYYPYYMAQVVATYGEDGVIWLEDVQAEYDALASQYASYGLDLVAYGMADSVKMDIVSAAVEDAVVLAKAAELGLDQLDDATMAAIEEDAKATFEMYLSYYYDYYYAEAEEITDEMRAEAEAYWASNGADEEIIAIDMAREAIFEAVYAEVTKDVALTEEDVEEAYQALIEANKSSYTNDATYNSDRNAGVAIAWNPEGYRAVKHVLIQFDDEQSQRYSDLEAQLTSLNAEKEAIENPAEETEEDAEPVELRTIEEVNADIAACATELESLYTQLLPTAEEVIEKFNKGTSFENLIAEYNTDPGMQSEPIATIGYAVSADSTTWDPAFTEGSMSIAEKGGISEPVYSSFGIHIIWYMDDVPAGEVALEEIRSEVEIDALDAKIQNTYSSQVAAWLEEMNVEYHFENFGIAA